ncbi:MAG: EscR/YscR/HrcR family type III secretion system export apparatus protein [Pseudomonadota bacterium]
MSIEDLPNPLVLAGIIFLTGLLPLGLATVTAFVKISVVLSILRNALGLQQTPPNLVLNAGAIVLTLYVMYPVILKIGDGLESLPATDDGFAIITSALPIVMQQIRDFMSPLIEPTMLDFFMSTARKIWPAEVMATVQPDDFLIVLPSFFVSEMQSALELGVIIFIPFLIIDMIVANTMMALGMIMVPPTMIALPIKLMFFVGVSGWSLVVDRLLSSYAVGL